MPPITEGKLKGFYMPDYDGGCIVNLLSSIIRSRGGRSPHRELKDLPASELEQARTVIYLVLDGIGASQLDEHLRSGRGRAFFGANPYRVISTVFPATTAAAVTTFGSGATPAEHGILGWHLHLHDLGMVTTILPGTTRTGVPLADEDFDLAAYLRLPSYVETAAVRRELLSFGHIVRSRFSQAGTRWTRRASYQAMRGMERRVLSSARRHGRGLAYAYWPGYDSVCHEKGCLHPKTRKHIEQLDVLLARLVERLAGMDVMLLVLADHGLVDAPLDKRIDLAHVPGFYDCLAALPSGDSREVSCFVRPARVARFLEIVEQHLSAACVCVPGEELIAMGAFGPGKPHPALANRLGDFVLLATGPHAFTSTLPGSETEFNEANHGGMSEAEVRVPLYVMRC